MIDAGRLDCRFRFENRQPRDDGAGNVVSGPWTLQYEAAGNRKFLRGGESVIAARLESRQPAIITIRDCRQARRITASWRAIDRDGTVYAIRENPKLSDDRGYLEFLVEAGVAA